jgi:hypothetical protein
VRIVEYPPNWELDHEGNPGAVVPVFDAVADQFGRRGTANA